MVICGHKADRKKTFWESTELRNDLNLDFPNQAYLKLIFSIPPPPPPPPKKRISVLFSLRRGNTRLKCDRTNKKAWTLWSNVCVCVLVYESRRLFCAANLPRLTVLLHPKVNLFITNCANNAMLEGVHSFTPMITRPYFGNQPINSNALGIPFLNS